MPDRKTRGSRVREILLPSPIRAMSATTDMMRREALETAGIVRRALAADRPDPRVAAESDPDRRFRVAMEVAGRTEDDLPALERAAGTRFEIWTVLAMEELRAQLLHGLLRLRVTGGRSRDGSRSLRFGSATICPRSQCEGPLQPLGVPAVLAVPHHLQRDLGSLQIVPGRTHVVEGRLQQRVELLAQDAPSLGIEAVEIRLHRGEILAGEVGNGEPVDGFTEDHGHCSPP